MTTTVCSQSYENYHLAYGFPSSHSTNAICRFILLRRRLQTYSIRIPHPNHGHTTSFIVYALPIVLRPIHIALHLVIDRLAGYVLGAVVWWPWVVTEVPTFQAALCCTRT
ncbi:hypothetical protein BDP27DRAFT_294026 [Rhodocollybia butyracea]|uniref:Uncharacterized protein n=1 Tax=Rhodocollybia butyracea TaxID=206335 RepID=A0A9P5PFF0_9AGAR|nr:hypothetical protein BDP27DRAFT_294026 [Rhodocollybia butyracea]